MLLKELVSAWQDVGATRSRTAKTQRLADVLSLAQGKEVPLVVTYLAGDLPQGRIGIGYAALRDTHAAPAATAALTLRDVDAAFDAIAAESGPGSNGRRLDRLGSLLATATADEQSFLTQLLGGGLRQGALGGVMQAALAEAFDASLDEVRRAAMLAGDLSAVARLLATEGRAGLATVRLRLFTPLSPMLAQSAESVPEALERTGESMCEVKIDGARVQIHREGDRIALYTRNLKDVTGRMPEIVDTVASLDVDSIILDGEVIAYRRDGRPHPFQETMGRFGTRDSDESLPSLSLHVFDCLHIDGTDLIDHPLRERWATLAARLPDRVLVDRIEAADAAEATQFYEKVVAAGHEGVMVKSLGSPYEAGRRGASWIKVKPSHTLDLVVIGVEWGSGRRRGWLSNIHLGARDPDTGEFVMLGKTFKGMTDEMLAWQTERFLELETGRDGHVVWVRPEQVVEIAIDGIQSSSRYPGGMALRFARVKGYRDDKTALEADTIDTVRAIFERR